MKAHTPTDDDRRRRRLRARQRREDALDMHEHRRLGGRSDVEAREGRYRRPWQVEGQFGADPEVQRVGLKGQKASAPSDGGRRRRRLWARWRLGDVLECWRTWRPAAARRRRSETSKSAEMCARHKSAHVCAQLLLSTEAKQAGLATAVGDSLALYTMRDAHSEKSESDARAMTKSVSSDSTVKRTLE